MCLEKILKIRRTLAFRVTLWYAIVFSISSIGAFFIFYMIMKNIINDRIDQELLNDLAEFSSISKLKGDESLKSELIIEAESDGVEKVFFRLLDPAGKEMATSDMSSWRSAGIGRSALEQVMQSQNHVFETLSLPDRPYNVRIVYGAIGPGKILQIGLSLEEEARFFGVFREVFILGITTIVVFSGVIGWLMAKGALIGVEEITNTAIEISQGAFETRVQVKAKGGEIAQLAEAFNRMLDRIQELVKGLKELTENIAHDVKTPITRIRGLAESELSKGKPNDLFQSFAADIIEECDSLLQMINTMLAISEAEAGISGIFQKQVDLIPIIRKALELFRPLAEEKGIHLVSQASGSAYVWGDIHRLQRMIVNLLENAIKFTHFGGSVTVSINEENEQILIAVHDTGIGISKDDLPHIFKRLYRCDASRSEPGFGLGLSLAQAIVKSHGGDIKAESTPGKGSTFTVSLPWAPKP